MDKLRETLARDFAKVITTDLLKSLREQGWERFQTLGLPDKKVEAFRYVPLSALYAADFVEATLVEAPSYLEHIYPECQDSHIVFVNGIYAPHLSKIPQGVIVLPLNEAMTTYGHFLKSRVSRSLSQEKDPFASLNAALHPGGVFVYIPPKQEMSPLQCHQIFTSSVAACPRIHLFVGAHSTCDWIATLQKEGNEGAFVNSLFDVALEEGASFKQSQLAICLGEQDWFFEAMRATLKKNSTLQVVSVTTGAKTVRHDYHATLTGVGAEATLQGVWLLNEHREAHTHVVIDHAAPHCRSMQLFKGILDGHSRSSFEGKIYVRQEAQKTEAYQLNKHLLLGERVLANSKPNLEIFADDVKASHGATMTQVDARELFYLKARGIPEKAAKELLIRGFYEEVIEKIPHAFVRQKVKEVIS